MFGTNFTFDLLATANAQTILQLGADKVYDGIEQGLAIHNRLTSQVFDLFAEVRNETIPGQFRNEVYGGNSILTMRPVDQIGVVDTQKTAAGYTVGFPMDRVQGAIGWTRDYLEQATAEELVRDFNAFKEGDKITMRTQLLKAIFTPTNRTLVDRIGNHVAVDVKALINADGAEIPLGPNGEVFDGATHQHYIASASVTQATIKTLIENVKEHYNEGKLYLFIEKSQEAAVRGFTDFIPLVQFGVTPSTLTDRIAGNEQNFTLNDREIGMIYGATVMVKPWMFAGYYFCLITGPSVKKIARFRQRKGGLYLAGKFASFPLQADIIEHDFGAGVLERTAASILYGGGASYVAPTFT